MPIHHHTVDHLHILHLFHQPEGIVRQIQLGLHILYRLLLFGAQIDIILIHLDRLLKPIGLVAQITHVAIGINHPSLDSHRQMFFSRFQITRFITAHTVPQIIGGIARCLFHQLLEGRFSLVIFPFGIHLFGLIQALCMQISRTEPNDSSGQKQFL